MINGKIIAIDARMIEMSGIGTYIQHLIDKEIYDYALGDEDVIYKYNNNIKVISFKAPIYSIKEQLFFPNSDIKENKIQLIHFPHYNVPFLCKSSFVVTVHDLTHIVLPEFLGNKIKYYYASFLMKNALNRSRHIFTVSEYSMNDIVRVFNIKKDKISITYDAVDDSFRIKQYSEIEYLYKKYSILKNKRILLYVGNLKPHKNLKKLLMAFSLLDNKEEYVLILAGKAFNSLQLEDVERDLHILEYIIHTGYIENEELIDLYNMADLFVFPSLYEGFGIPPLEAMACGTPVIASNRSSVPEVVGDAAILFDPVNENDIKEKIEFIFMNEKKKNELVNLGLKQSKKFSWDNTVDTVKNKIRGIL